jgi:phospho-N-acetylmuramoyl-pentapeptide-transferase
MFYYLHMLSDYWGGFNLFKYISIRATAAALMAFLIMTLIGPAFIRALRKQKLGEETTKGDSAELDKKHAVKADTPTMGGLVVVFALVVSTLFWARITVAYVGLLLLVTVSFAALGFVDDFIKLTRKDGGKHGLKIRTKFACLLLIALGAGALLYAHLSGVRNICVPVLKTPAQIAVPPDGSAEAPDARTGESVSAAARPNLAALVLAPLDVITPDSPAAEPAKPAQPESPESENLRESALSLYFPFFKNLSIYLGVFFIFFVALVLTASSNAVNLTDGIDGLAAGSMVMVSLAFVVLSYLIGRGDVAAYLQIVHVPGAGEVAIFCAALFGACMGFLWFNCYPAQVFMGDTGSLALGGAIGFVAVIIKQELLLPIVGGIFVVEALSVIIQVASFRLFGRRVFRIAPLHHHFEFKNWPEPKITVRFCIIGVILAIFAVASLKLR